MWGPSSISFPLTKWPCLVGIPLLMNCTGSVCWGLTSGVPFPAITGFTLLESHARSSSPPSPPSKRPYLIPISSVLYWVCVGRGDVGIPFPTVPISKQPRLIPIPLAVYCTDCMWGVGCGDPLPHRPVPSE